MCDIINIYTGEVVYTGSYEDCKTVLNGAHFKHEHKADYSAYMIQDRMCV